MQLTGWTNSPRSQEIENDEEDEHVFESKFEEEEGEEDEEDCYFQVEFPGQQTNSRKKQFLWGSPISPHWLPLSRFCSYRCLNRYLTSANILRP